MFHLVYNIDFEIIALLFAVMLFIETCVCYPSQTKKNKTFRLMAVMVIITEVFDLASAFTNTYGAQVPHWLSMLVNSGYFMCGLFLCFMFHYYIENAVVPENGKSVLMGLNRLLLVAIDLAVVFNWFFGYFFSFSPEGTYVRGPMYLVMHFTSCWFVLCASASLIVNWKLLKKPQIVASLAFVLLYFSAVAVQTFLLPDVLVIMPAVSAMLIIATFSLESPDYIQLQRILQELTDTKLELEEANRKYYNMAYTDLMTGLENRTAYHIRLEQLNAAVNKTNIIFMMADINNLKYLNDHLGHLVGDDAIEKAAGLIRKIFGEKCHCYRIGGDEFAVISEECSTEDFEMKYQVFRKETQVEGRCAKYPFAIASGWQAVGKQTMLDAMRKADENMYRDKAAFKQAAEGARKE